MKIKPTSLVLEIGSGDNPNPRSNVLVDKYFDPTPHRKYSKLITDERPVIIADIENLPFRQKSFDYVICSHVIEHVPNCESAFKELIRVGKSGYIETPSIFTELIVGKHDIHLWYILTDGSTIFLNRKNENNILKYNASDLYDIMFSDYFLLNSEIFLVRYEWENVIQYKILTDDEMKTLFSTHVKAFLANYECKHKFNKSRFRFAGFLLKEEMINLVGNIFPWYLKLYDKKLCRKKIRERKKISVQSRNISWQELEKVICCPFCKNDIVKNDNAYYCKMCEKLFEIKNGIPLFL